MFKKLLKMGQKEEDEKRSLRDYAIVDIKEKVKERVEIKGIKAIKIRGYSDIERVSKELYRGYIIVVNLNDIVDREERIILEKEFKSLTKKIKGDIAKLNDSNYLILTPTNIKKKKVIYTKEFAYEKLFKKDLKS